MANDTGYERMNELIATIQRALSDLEAGKLSHQGLEECTEEARALYERLIVLRHKARETATRPSATFPGPVTVKPDVPSAPIATEAPPMRLDTRPVEVSPRQTSLIDAIAEIGSKPAKKAPKALAIAEAKTAPPVIEPVQANAAVEKPDVVKLAAEPAPAKAVAEKPMAKTVMPKAAPKTAPAPTLADKMEHAPITDLHKAIALSQKFWFVAELFGGQRENYEKAINAINAAKSIEQARTYIDSEVTAKLPKPPSADVLSAFMELVERRFR